MPTSYSYKIISRNPVDPADNYPQRLFRGPSAVINFWSAIEADVKKIGEIYRKEVPMNMTPEDRESVNLNTHPKCHICKKVGEREEMVRDHCHLTGEYVVTPFKTHHLPLGISMTSYGILMTPYGISVTSFGILLPPFANLSHFL